MATDRTLTAKISPFGLRLQPDLKVRLEAASRANERSLNSEIAMRLELSFEADQETAEFRFLDAFESDVVPRARVVARAGLAIAEGTKAVDFILIDAPLAARITAVTGDDRRVHDAAKAAIEAAFPRDGMTWGQISEALASLGAKAPAPAMALREALEKRLADTPAIAGQVAL